MTPAGKAALSDPMSKATDDLFASTASHPTLPGGSESPAPRRPRPTPVQLRWLARGLDQPGGKLPLFDEQGQKVHPRTVLACLAHGWATRWFANPLKPDWLVCRLTDSGRALAIRHDGRG